MMILAAVCALAGGDSYFPLGKGHKWVYKTDYDEDTLIVHEVTASEKVGDAECLVVETRSINEKESRNRLLRKEWLGVSDEGIRIHKIQRGRTEMDIETPFFKLKRDLRKDDEWEGEAKAEENPAKHHYRVETEEEVEVPAGKFKAIKVMVKVESGSRHVAEGYEWYAKGVGMVKSEMTIKFQGEGPTIVSELKEFKPGK
ncbi:MAG TPA: hypothetical protein VEN81_02675 [Planctomycetota bacterium]|nr:hypothetical protein [Planctomycetota bacterium]